MLLNWWYFWLWAYSLRCTPAPIRVIQFLGYHWVPVKFGKLGETKVFPTPPLLVCPSTKLSEIHHLHSLGFWFVSLTALSSSYICMSTPLHLVEKRTTILSSPLENLGLKFTSPFAYKYSGLLAPNILRRTLASEVYSLGTFYALVELVLPKVK